MGNWIISYLTRVFIRLETLKWLHPLTLISSLSSAFLLQALTSTALKKGGLHAADVATQYKYRNTLFDVKIDTDSNVKSPLSTQLLCLGRSKTMFSPFLLTLARS